MRKAELCGLLLLVSVSASCQRLPAPLQDAQRQAIAQEVEETLGRLTEAMNAHDPEAVLGFYRHSEEFVYLGCTDFLLGFDTFSTRVGPYYPAHPEVTFHQEVVRTQVLSPTVAVVALRGGSSAAEALFWTEVLIRSDDGRWLVSYEHESWPGCPPPSGPHVLTTEGDTVNGGGAPPA